MTPDSILCRCCRVDYARADGCAICEPAKANIIWPAMQPDADHINLHDLARTTVGMLREQLRRISHSQREAPTGHYDPALGGELSKISRAVATVLTEARKLEEREAARVKTAGFDEMLEIYGEWIMGLPQEYRMQALGWMERKLLPAAPDADLVDE